MKEQLKIIVLCFQFDFVPKFVIIRTLFYFLFNMMNVLSIFVACLILLVYAIGVRLLNVVGANLM